MREHACLHSVVTSLSPAPALFLLPQPFSRSLFCCLFLSPCPPSSLHTTLKHPHTPHMQPHTQQAVDNFLALCRGVDVGGLGHLSYVGVPFTRIVRRFVIQAGDVVNRDGTGRVAGLLCV